MSQATTIDEHASTRGRVARARLASIIQRQGALVALILVCTLAALRYPQFLTENNLLNVLRQNSMLGLVALGMTFVILTGGIDLSVGSLAAAAGVPPAVSATRTASMWLPSTVPPKSFHARPSPLKAKR